MIRVGVSTFAGVLGAIVTSLVFAIFGGRLHPGIVVPIAIVATAANLGLLLWRNRKVDAPGAEDASSAWGFESVPGPLQLGIWIVIAATSGLAILYVAEAWQGRLTQRELSSTVPRLLLAIVVISSILRWKRRQSR